MSPSTTGARSATGRTRKPLGWLPWVLLLILALVIALVVLVVVGNDDDDDDARPQTGPVTLVVDRPATA
jgi:hypothetical protein